MTLDITKTCLYKVLKVLDVPLQPPLNAVQIATLAGLPEPTVRRTLADLKKVGKVKRIVTDLSTYTLK